MTAWKEQALQLFMAGTSKREISRKLDVPYSSLWEWLDKNVDGKEAIIDDSAHDLFVSDEGIKPRFTTESKVTYGNILLISDMHIPYHHKDTLDFLSDLNKEYKPSRIIGMGDECFPPDVEILTEAGFVQFKDLQEEKVAQWHEDGSIDFVEPLRKVQKKFSGELIQFKHKSISIRCTPKHNLVKVHPLTRKVHKREAWDVDGSHSWYIPRFGKAGGNGVDLQDDEIRLMVAFQADGTFTKGAARFSFTKQRKIDRLHYLLSSCNIPYNMHVIERGDTQFYIEVANVPAYFTKEFSMPFSKYSAQQREVFLREVGLWDGTEMEGHTRYVSCVVKNVEYVQRLAIISGYYASKISKSSFDASYVDIVWNRENSSLKSCDIALIKYDGEVFCVSVPSSMIIIRCDGHISVVGNCDKHALSFHDSDPELPSAGDELRAALPVISQLHKLFPRMDLLESNHGSLIYRKAKHHGIPRQYLRTYNEVLGVGAGWRWHFDLTVKMENDASCYFHHGKTNNILRLSQQMGMCAASGHYHNDFAVRYWANPNALYWALQTGCLIDDKSLAFTYNNVNVQRPIIGTAVIVEGSPILVPMKL